MGFLLGSFLKMFNLISRPVTMHRMGVTGTFKVRIAPTNYDRNLSGPSETIIPGRQFLIPKNYLISSGFPIPVQRNDRIVDPDLGTLTIDGVSELYDIGGEIIAWKVFTG